MPKPDKELPRVLGKQLPLIWVTGKRCTCCREIKNSDDFHKNKTTKTGLHSQCKKCTAIQTKKYRSKHPDKIKKVRDESRWKYKGKYRETEKKWREKNKIVLAENKSKYYQENKKFIIKKPRAPKQSKEEKNKNQKEWKANNREQINKYNRKYRKLRNIIDPKTKIAFICRGRILAAIKSQQTCKKSSTTDLIGCTVPEYTNHIEKQFLPGMTWSNHGIHGWHVDHIIPISKFDLTRESQQRKAFHYTNTQPLWAADNLKKGDSYDTAKATTNNRKNRRRLSANPQGNTTDLRAP